jgi:MraZ protein
MLLGEYEHKIDEKGRVTIPPKFRSEFREGGVLAQGLEKCIAVYPLSLWKRMAEKFASMPLDRVKARRRNRYLFATAFDFELDGQGRIALPLPLRRYAGIKNSVVIVGVNNYLELWNKDCWEAEQAIMNEQIWHIAESMETF